jgi:hypothetical protein
VCGASRVGTTCVHESHLQSLIPRTARRLGVQSIQTMPAGCTEPTWDEILPQRRLYARMRQILREMRAALQARDAPRLRAGLAAITDELPMHGNHLPEKAAAKALLARLQVRWARAVGGTPIRKLDIRTHRLHQSI